MPDDGRMEITLRDVYEAQQSTGAQVAAVVGQLAILTAQVTGRLDSGQKKLDDHEQRIRAGEQSPKVPPEDFSKLGDRVSDLESWRGKAVGVGLTLTAMTGVAAVLVAHAMH